MRAAQITDCYLPVINGVTTFVRLFKRTLAAEGADPYIFTSGHTRYPDDEPNVIRSPGLPLGATGYYAAPRHPARVWQAARRMEVLHAHHPFLALGFAVICLAEVKSVALFGLLTAVTMLSALVGELFVTPAVILTFARGAAGKVSA